MVLGTWVHRQQPLQVSRWQFPSSQDNQLPLASLEFLIVPTTRVAAARGPTPQEGFQLICSLLLFAPRGLPLLPPILLAFLLVLALLVFAFLFCSLFFLLKVMKSRSRVNGQPTRLHPTFRDPGLSRLAVVGRACTSLPFFFFFFFSLEGSLLSLSAQGRQLSSYLQPLWSGRGCCRYPIPNKAWSHRQSRVFPCIFVLVSFEPAQDENFFPSF